MWPVLPRIADLMAALPTGSVPDAAPVLLSERGGRLVVLIGDVVVKVHVPDTDPRALDRRVRFAAAAGSVFLAPVAGPLCVDDRLVTAWPAADIVDHEAPDAAPWAAAGDLLARLHALPVPHDLPPTAGPSAVARTVGRLDGVDHLAARPVRRAFQELPPWTYGAERRCAAVVHGDWHMGQLAHRDGWRLIDVDDLGVGEPVWDLARPAGLLAAGLLEPVDWDRFLAAYRSAGGPAEADPWPQLDAPARALVVRMAAQSVLAAEAGPLDEAAEALVEACARMSQ